MLALQDGLNESDQTNLWYNDIPFSGIIYHIKQFCIIFSVAVKLTVITISKYYVML